MDEAFLRHDNDEDLARLKTARPCCARAALPLTGGLALVLGAVVLVGSSASVPSAHQSVALGVAKKDVSGEGTCVQPGKFLADCDRLDAGSCGVACCTVEIAVPNVDPLEAYSTLRDLLLEGGPDGRYSATSSKSEDVQSEVPFTFSPPLPWRFTLTGQHTTDGTWASAGRWRDGTTDILRFAVGVASIAGDVALTRVRLHSLSGPGPTLVDFGQNFKNVALLCQYLNWPRPTPIYGCGIGQATGWRPANATTVALQNRDGVCLDAKQRNQNGGVVQMWACDPTNLNQLWNVDVKTGLIKNRDGICLDSSEHNSQPGGAVLMWACDPTNRNQQWRFDPANGLISSAVGSCLDASERQTNGGKVLMWPCDASNKNQQWMARAVEGRLGTLPVRK